MANVIAFHTGALAQYPVAEAIRRIAAAGYGGVELNAETLPWAVPHVTPALSPAERRAIRQAAVEAGVTITSLSAHISLVDADPGARRAAVTFDKGCADLALELGTNVIHGLTGVVPASVPRAEAWGWACEAVGEIATYCAERGVRFGIEPVVGMLVSGVDEMVQLMTDLPSVPVGVNYDPSHLVVRGDDPAAAARRFGDRITAVHLKDGSGTQAHFEFPPLGKGAVDFAALAVALREVGYAGALAVEYEAHVFGGYEWSEEQVLSGSLAFVRRYFK